MFNRLMDKKSRHEIQEGKNHNDRENSKGEKTPNQANNPCRNHQCPNAFLGAEENKPKGVGQDCLYVKIRHAKHRECIKTHHERYRNDK